MAYQLGFHHREFEYDVRKLVNKREGPVFDTDVSAITELDCSNYSFRHEDIDALSRFRNLERLSVEIGDVSLSFLNSFEKLKELDIVFWSSENVMDFSVLADLSNLESLFVSGGGISSMDFVNVHSLTRLKKLTNLHLHEFGAVDLSFLSEMPWIESFFCGYADKVSHAECIGMLGNLKSLTLIDIELEDLSFLDHLPDTMSLELCGDEVHAGVGRDKLSRFARADISDMTFDAK